VKLAISNIAWLAEDDESVYQLMKKYGYTGLEIAPSRIIPDAPYDRLEDALKWKNAIQEKGFVIPSIQSIWYGRTENIFAGEDERESLKNYTEKAILFAEAIGCPNLVWGCPKNRQVPEGVNEELAEQIAIPFFKELGQAAAEHHTVIALEAVPAIYNTNFINDTVTAIEFIQKVNTKGFRLNLDIGTIIENKEACGMIRDNIDLVNHVHISEPGLKEIVKRQIHKELNDLLECLHYSRYISIEMGKGNHIEKVMEYVANIFGD